jgi:hypothetical protein
MPNENLTNDPPMKTYNVAAEVNFRIRATSITAAYKEFHELMTTLFNKAFDESPTPIIVPSYFEGLAVERIKE